MTLLAKIEANARKQPDAIVHRWSGGELTWGDLWAQSGALASALAAQLPPDESPIAVWVHKQSLGLVAFLGCVRAGHPYVPVDDSTPIGRVSDVLAGSQACALLAVSDLPADIVTPSACEVWDAERIQDAARGAAQPSAELAVAGKSPWYLIFTSGSTGTPKGVPITANALEQFSDWVTRLAADAGVRPVVLGQAPWSFDLSVMDLYLTLATGGTLVSVERQHLANPAALVQALHGSQATVWVSTPSFAQLCLDLGGLSAGSIPVREFLFCGETLAPMTAQRLLEEFPQARVRNTYGPTEATVAVSEVEITREVLADYASLPVGRARPGCALTIRDARGAVLPDGAQGEIWIHGDMVSPGYVGASTAARKVFGPAMVDGREMWTYRTGDLGQLSDGMLFFAGRIDDQIKMHGYRIELGDIESHVNALSLVTRSIVVPRKDKSGAITHLQAFAELSDPEVEPSLATVVQLKSELRASLPEYMIPKIISFVDRLPLTVNGKVDRRATEKLA